MSANQDLPFKSETELEIEARRVRVRVGRVAPAQRQVQEILGILVCSSSERVKHNSGVPVHVSCPAPTFIV